jgi:Spy/CpxP family protein refolding chaperone
MKKVYITLVMVMATLTLLAQNRPVQERAYMRANPAKLEPQLTAEQQDAIDKLHFEAQKEFVKLNAQVAEKRAELRLLQQEDSPSLRKINSKIDEISELNNTKMKVMAEKRMKIRELLTEEQKVYFDSRMNNMGRRGSRGSVYGGMRDGMRGSMRGSSREGMRMKRY